MKHIPFLLFVSHEGLEPSSLAPGKCFLIVFQKRQNSIPNFRTFQYLKTIPSAYADTTNQLNPMARSFFVRMKGLEPPRLSATGFESVVATITPHPHKTPIKAPLGATRPTNDLAKGLTYMHIDMMNRDYKGFLPYSLNIL